MNPNRSGGPSTAGLACLLGVVPMGCYADTVAPGYYGSPDDAGGAASPPAATVDPQGLGPTLGDGSAPAAGSGPEGDASDSSAGAGATTTVGCDLSGRWIATARMVATGLGAVEADHQWAYLELGQTGSSGSVTKGLTCGENVRGISSVAANVDYAKTWPAMLVDDLQTGRKFTSSASSGGCAVTFEKRYQVLGATASFYQDPSQAMPPVSQQATSTAPGWEDWDNDGNPGFTMNVTGLTTGQIYVALRRWTVWSGNVATGASTLKLAIDWDSDTDLLGYSGSSLLEETASGVRDSDTSLHFVVLARLAATQATGTDAAICTAIRSLAPSLTSSADN